MQDNGDESAENQRLAEVYRTLLYDDEYDIKRCYLVLKHKIDWGKVNASIGTRYIDFHWLIYNGGLSEFRFQGNPSGRVRYRHVGKVDTDDFAQQPELVGSLNIQRKRQECLTLRLYLSDSDMRVLQWAKEGQSQSIVFDFSHIGFIVKGITPDGGWRGVYQITVPSEWEEQIPDTIYIS
jgi:hypothetical protein